MKKTILIIFLFIIIINFASADVTEDLFNRSDRALNGDTSNSGQTWSSTGCDILSERIDCLGSERAYYNLSQPIKNGSVNLTYSVQASNRADWDFSNQNSDVFIVMSCRSNLLYDLYGGWQTIGACSSGTKHTFTMNFDFASNQFDLFYNGNTYTRNFYAAADSFTEFSLTSFSSNHGYYDDIKLIGQTDPLITNSYPVVDLVSPINNDHTNDATPSFIFNYSDSDSDAGNCNLLINNSFYGDNTSVTAGTQATITANSSLSDDVYSWFISCNDGTETTNSSARNLVIDTDSPDITWINPTTNKTTYNNLFVFNASINDTYLYAYNYNLYNSLGEVVQSGQLNDINASQMNVNATFDFDALSSYGKYILELNVSDDHTARYIDDYDYWISNEALWFEYDGTIVNISGSKNDISQITVERLDDGYTFGFDYNNNKKKRTYTLTSNKPLYYREMYSFASFVTGLHWVDFNIPNESVSYNVNKISPYIFEIETVRLNNHGSDHFESIGGLNIISEDYSITYQDQPSVASNALFAWFNNTYQIQTLNLSTLLNVEKFNISFNISDGDSHITDVEVFFRNTAGDNSSDKCLTYGSSLGTIGNLQSNQCNQWISTKITNGVIQSTGTVGSSAFQGDGVVLTNFSNHSNSAYFSILLDEIYKPVFKLYPFNSSSVFYSESLTGGEINGNILRRVILDSGNILIPSNASAYSFNSRINTSSASLPSGLELWICNDKYISGKVATSGDCVFVGSKGTNEIQDNNKIRFIVDKTFFSSNFPIYNNITNFSIVYRANDLLPTQWYSLQTSYNLNNSKNKTYYSLNGGSAWTLQAGITDLTNVNWVYDNTTCFEYYFNIDTSDETDINTATYSSCWTTSGSENLPPSKPIIMNPNVSEIIAGTYNITWLKGSDPNGDIVYSNVSIYNNDSSFNTSLLSHSSLENYSFYTGSFDDGDYYLQVTQFENDTSELYFSSENHSFSIDNFDYSFSGENVTDAYPAESETSQYFITVTGDINNISSAVIQILKQDNATVNKTLSLQGNILSFTFDNSMHTEYKFGDYTYQKVFLTDDRGVLNTFTGAGLTMTVTAGSEGSGGFFQDPEQLSIVEVTNKIVDSELERQKANKMIISIIIGFAILIIIIGLIMFFVSRG